MSIKEEIFPPSFHLFKAGWKTDDQLPKDWYTEHTTSKPKFYAFFWAPELQVTSNRPEQKNANDFKELITTLNNHNLKTYEFIPTVSTGSFNRSEAIEQLNHLTGINKGDCCLIYYSGLGILNESAKITAGEKFINEPFFTGDKLPGEYLKSIGERIRELTTQNGIHLFLLLDFQMLWSFEEAVPVFPADAQNNLVVLESPAQIVNFSDKYNPLNSDNFFFEELANIIESTGAKMRYSNLLSRLQLRYYQAELSEKPTMTAFPANTLNNYIFSGIFSGKSDYKVFYNEEHKNWEINAGSLNGIPPSLSFMHTKFSLEDGRQVSIYNTFDSYSTLLNFDEADTENTYDASLVQTALPKMKVGFHEQISTEMKSAFIKEVKRFNIYFIDLLEDTREAAFLIKNRSYEYYLVRNRGYKGNHDDRPVFFYQQNIREFIKQLEYIAQWQALLEFENSRINIRTEEIELIFEIIEGRDEFDENTDLLPAVSKVNPESLQLHYRHTKQPVFRCKLNYQSNSTTEGYHVNFLYLDSRFGIEKIKCFDNELLQNNQPVWAAINFNGKQYKSIPTKIEDFYIDNEIFEIQDFLLVIFSTQPLDVTALTQPYLEPNNQQLSRSVSIEESRQSFTLPEGDWFVKKIPIRVKYDPRNFEQTVIETAGKRAITTPDDLQKNRWGGQVIKNGFELSGEVKSNLIPGLYNVVLQVKHKEIMLTSGDVAFLLHDSFSSPIRFEKFRSGVASLSITAYEDFTAGAILYDGTELELDLSEMEGLPSGFYAKAVADDFIIKVEKLLKEKHIMVTDDLQKNRWGGKSESNGKKLSASVTKENSLHQVTFTVESILTTPLNGEVAFFLHDSFGETVKFRKAVNGKATYKLNSYEAFTVGVYLEDGTELELDLNNQEGFPAEFYYKRLQEVTK